MTLHVYAASALTGRIYGRLDASTWSCSDPLTGSGQAQAGVSVRSLRHADVLRGWLHQGTQLVFADERRDPATEVRTRHLLWGGPLATPPVYADGILAVEAVDWRGWLRSLFLRPDPAVADWSGDYIRVGPNAVDPTTALSAVMRAALSSPGTPPMMFAPVVPVGTTRPATYRATSTIGSIVDDLEAGPAALEWWVDLVDGESPDLVVPRINTAPTRFSRDLPIRLVWTPAGGNISPPSQPPQTWPPGRVWALGQGTPPDLRYGSDEDPDLADGGLLLREDQTDLAETAYTRSAAADYAAQQRQLLARPEPTLSLTHQAGDPDVVGYTTGDTATVTVDDQLWHTGAHTVSVDAARIVDRTITRGDDGQVSVTVTLDLGDDTQAT